MSTAETSRRRHRIAFSCAIPLLLVACAWAFAQAGLDYLRWYMDHGTRIAAVILLGALTFDKLCGDHDLISAHPADYFRAHLYGAGSILVIFGKHLTAAFTPQQRRYQTLWDMLATLAVSLLLVPCILAYLVLVVPANYLVTLVAGAPSRSFRNALSDVAQEAGPLNLLARPLAVTQAISAPLLFLLGRALY